MIQIVSVVSALLWCILYFILIHVINMKFNIDLKVNAKKIIIDKSVYIIGLVSTLCVGLIAFLHFGSMHIVIILYTFVNLLLLAVICITDLKKQLVPNALIIGGLIVWGILLAGIVITNIYEGATIGGKSIAGGVFAGTVFLLCYVLSKHQLGAGDVKIVFLMGLLMTSDRIFGPLIYGSVLCCVFSIIQLLRKKVTMKSGVPMVPFLFIGTVITYMIV